MTIAAQPLLAALRECGLFDRDQLAEIAALQEGSPDRSVAEQLIARGMLTTWQADELQAGRRQLSIGKYILLDKLGEGGMGAVYKARHAYMKWMVAIKVISKRCADNEGALARFQREIQVAASLEHANIIRAMDADEEQGVWYLVMQYVQGRDLSKFIRERGRLPLDWSCECIRQACLGLQHASERGVVHRDIKPANLLVEEQADRFPLLKVLDLGLAGVRRNEDFPEGSLTATCQVFGTPDYMSPEHVRGAKSVDVRSDIFSLGCTLFEMLAGRLPFVGDHPMERMVARIAEEAPSLELHRRDAPKPLQRVVAGMLAKAPGDRFQTHAEVAEALAPFCLARAPESKPSSDRPARHSECAPSADPSSVDTRPHLSTGDTKESKLRWVREPQPRTPPARGAPARTTPSAELPVRMPAPVAPPAPLKPVPAASIRARRTPVAVLVAALGGAALLLSSGYFLFSPQRDVAGPSTPMVINPGVLSIDAGRLLRVRIVATGAGQLGFYLQSGAPAEMQLDRKTGELTYLPGWDARDAMFAPRVTVRAENGQTPSIEEQLEIRVRGAPLQKRTEYRDLTTRERAALETALEALGRDLASDPKDARIHNARGWLHAVRHEFSRAGEDFEQALRLDPKLATAWVGQSVVHARASATKALEDCDRAISLDARRPAAWARRGDLRGQTGMLAGATDDYEMALRIDPENLRARIGRIAIRLRRSEWDRALQECEQQLRKEPGHPAFLVERATAWLAKRETSKARADCSQAIQSDKDFARAYLLLGQVCLQSGDYQQAVEQLSAAIERESAPLQALLSRSEAWNRLGAFDKALADVASAAQLDAKSPLPPFYRGKLWAARDRRQAISELNLALELDPEFVPARIARGVAFVQAQEVERGMIDLNRAVALAPANAEALSARGAARIEERKYAEALDDLDQALQLTPESAGFEPERAGLLTRQALLLASAPEERHRDGRRAYAAGVLACELTKHRNSDALAALAAACAERGDFAKAVQHQQQCLALAEDSPARSELSKTLELYRQQTPYRLQK